MHDRRADADDGMHVQLGRNALLNAHGDRLKVLQLERSRQLLDKGRVRFRRGKQEIPVRRGKLAPDVFQHRRVGAGGLADDEHRAGRLGIEAKLLGAHIHIAGQNVVGDDVLDEGRRIVLVVVAGLGLAQRDGGHDRQRVGQLVHPVDKRAVFAPVSALADAAAAFPVRVENRVPRLLLRRTDTFEPCAHQGQI